jgi:tripartite-type tricarboxylate transporter receptor subunit TctC
MFRLEPAREGDRGATENKMKTCPASLLRRVNLECEDRAMRSRRRFLVEGLIASVGASGCLRRAFAHAKKPVHVIVGFPAGGGTDVIARVIADRLRLPFAASVLVENKAGGAARVAVDYVKSAEPDGSVVLFTPDFPITVYPHSFRSLSYDPLRDLIPIAPAAKSVLTFNIGPAVPQSATSLADFLQWCKSNPDRAAFATTAAGGTPHFVGVMLAGAAGVAMTPVHYRGGAPALQDLIGGHVPASVNPISEIMPFARSGPLRVLAVTGATRSPFLPDVPTMREQGYDVVVESWLGFFAPAKTPPDIVRALSRAIGEVTGSPEMAQSVAKFGNEPTFQSPEQFAATVKADLDRWGPVVKASGFVAEE